MNRKRVLAIVLAASMLAGSPLWADETATAPAGDRAQRLQEFIRAVERATHPSAAITAYARGCAIDRTQPEIHNVYMRRMLEFGLPNIAYYPAKTLTALEADNGMAWGVLGYVHGKRGELADALSAATRAADLCRGDPSILHSAGQLVAWYDLDPELPRIPDRTKRTIEKVRADSMKLPAFAKAYRAIEQAYQQRRALVRDFEKRIGAVEAEMLALEQLALDIDREIRDLNDEVNYRLDLIRDLQRDLYYANWYYYLDANGRYIYYYDPSVERPYPRDARARIRQEERAVDRLRLDVRKLRRRGQAVLKDIAGKRETLEELAARKKGALASVRERFRWDPPAVNGVVTAEVDSFPPVPPEALAQRESPEAKARNQLILAELYVRHDLPDKAVETLRELLSSYGSTEAAAEAKKLLAELKARK